MLRHTRIIKTTSAQIFKTVGACCGSPHPRHIVEYENSRDVGAMGFTMKTKLTQKLKPAGKKKEKKKMSFVS